MISLLLSSFIFSLIGIILMIGRKMILLRNGKISSILNMEEITFQVPYIREVKHTIIKNLKRYGYVGLVETMRFYVRSENIIKLKYQEVKIKIKNISAGNKHNAILDASGQPEVNKFLRMVSEYKHKIRKIKNQIHKEETK